MTLTTTNAFESERKPSRAAGRVRRGETLVEVLMASFILALILPAVFGTLAGSLRAQAELQRLDACRYGAQWWFSRVDRPASKGILEAMPRTTPDGALSFSWECSPGSCGALRVTLTVRARGASVPLVQARMF